MPADEKELWNSYLKVSADFATDYDEDDFDFSVESELASVLEEASAFFTDNVLDLCADFFFGTESTPLELSSLSSSSSSMPSEVFVGMIVAFLAY